jgi:predicted phosphodiesterase
MDTREKTIVNPRGRIIVLGDLQGCYTEAVRLLEKCEATSKDVVIMAGDLIDRGPDNDKCVDLAMHYEASQGCAAAVLGNHEERHLQYRDMDEKGLDPKVKIESHIQTRKQLRAEHYAYMRTLPLYIKLPEHNAVVVHAGLFPGVSLEQQEKQHLLHIQMVDSTVGYDDSGNRVVNKRTMWPSKAPTPSWKFWTNLYNGPERVIFGHSVFDKPLLTDKLAGIDGGACFGRSLHALIVDEWRIVSVEAPTDFGKGSRGRDGANIKMFNVHGDVNTFS